MTTQGTAPVPAEKELYSWESVRQLRDHPSESRQAENDPLAVKGDPTMSHQTSTHARITKLLIINQTSNPVSLELKNTEVRAYRTDPVQVRSCSYNSRFQLK
ncbi:hypothetical protein V6N13_079513 [Hibiscus sabdariffa]